jgi:transposase-like protein
MDEIVYSKRPNYRLYPESLKREVVLEYLTTDCSKMYLCRKYGVGSRTIVDHWLKKYSNHSQDTPLKKPKETPLIMAEDSLEIKRLKQRIQQLERELDDAKLLAKAYSLMIDTAEEELKIPIRKKFDTK